jgi:glycosyltransferase involved in cell wall biosynthesis
MHSLAAPTMRTTGKASGFPIAMPVAMKIEDSSIAYLTAGAAGMYCGSCMRDNALAREMQGRGLNLTLLPLYTPIRTDETDVSVDRVFFGGINVYLQQKIPLFRHLPHFLDRWLDHPWLIKRLASASVQVDAAELGALTLSMVRGESGFQRKEVDKLVRWLSGHLKPDLICLSNLLIGGCVAAIKRELGVPVLVTLQGDDLFLDELNEPYRGQVIAEMRRIASEVDGFIVFSDFYAAKMSELLEVPLEKFHQTALGIELANFESIAPRGESGAEGVTIGYFARVSPEKGFDHLVDAFIKLRSMEVNRDLRLKAGGWLAEKDREFFAAQSAKISAAGLDDWFDYVGSPDHDEKLAFFADIDLFSVPSPYEEPKGMPVLEAMACGLPVVQPAHGAYAQILEKSGGG